MSPIHGNLPHFEKAFASVGWFIPPYASLGFLSELAGRIHKSGYQLSVDELEESLGPLYAPTSLAAMVCTRYQETPIISDYAETIAESVEAHFFGLHHVAIAGLVPVIEGAGRQLLERAGVPHRNQHKNQAIFFQTLTEECKREVRERQIGATGELISVMDSFHSFAKNVLYNDSRKSEFTEEANQFLDGTNRHGITHGRYRDCDYGRPINFYKAVGAIDFLCLVTAFRENISWLSPDLTEQSRNLAAYYADLELTAKRGTVRYKK